MCQCKNRVFGREMLVEGRVDRAGKDPQLEICQSSSDPQHKSSAFNASENMLEIGMKYYRRRSVTGHDTQVVATKL